MNIGIIGANGFIGSHLVEFLSSNHSVKLILFGNEPKTTKDFNGSYYCVKDLDSDKLNQIFSSIDLVYYLASSSIPASTWQNPVVEIQNNLTNFLNFLESISRSGVKKIAFVSSAGTIYGPSKVKLNEEDVKHPFSPHGIIKLTMENFLSYYQKKYGLQYDIYRVSNVFGEGQNTKKGLGLINTFMEHILKMQQVTVYGDGMHLRNYIYVKDVVRLMSISLDSDIYKSNIWNVSSNNSFTINEVIEKIKDCIPEKFSVQYIEQRLSDNLHIDLDNSKILADCPDFVFTDFNSAILNVYNHLRSDLSLSSGK
ncbi:MAG: NAD-dependent epimerase/dehydratase family protein [Bacteroidota bacterium]